MDPETPPAALEGITVLTHRIERIAARARDVAHTFSAWALSVETASAW